MKESRVQIKCVLIERVGWSKRDFDNGRRHRSQLLAMVMDRKDRDLTKIFPCCVRCTGWKKKKKKGGKKRNRNNESKGQMSCQISETANCCEQSREYRWKGVARPLYLAAMLLFNLRASLVISVSAWLVRAPSLNSNSWNFSLGPFSSFYFLLIISFFSESSLFSDFLWYRANL